MRLKGDKDMKFEFIKSDSYKIIAYGNEKTTLIKMIESMCLSEDSKIIGYLDDEIKELNPNYIDCFITSKDKVYAVYKNEKYLIKYRLYELFSFLSDSYIYINQGCLANVCRIDHFKINIGGALLIVFKSGYQDYVSRRKLKEVKERLGIKNERKN